MKVGDKVLVRKPARESAFWYGNMTQTDGKVLEICEVLPSNVYRLLGGSGHLFAGEWLTPVIEHGGKYYRTAEEGDVGKTAIFSDFSDDIIIISGSRMTLMRVEPLGTYRFYASGTSWRYAMIEVKQQPANPVKTIEDHLKDGINCETYEEKYALLSYLDELGYRWRAGQKMFEWDWASRKRVGPVWASDSRKIYQPDTRGSVNFSELQEYRSIMDKYPTPDKKAESPENTEAFDGVLEQYLEDTGIWCDIYEEKYALLSYLGDKGYKWRSGASIHAYNWSRDIKDGGVMSEGKHLTHGSVRNTHRSFSDFLEYSGIMDKYAPKNKAEMPSDKPAETPAKHEGPTWPMEAPKGGTITFNPAIQVELDKSSTEYRKTLEKLQNGAFVTHVAEGPLTIDETGVKSVNKAGYDGIDCWLTPYGQLVQYDPSKVSSIYDEKPSEEILNPAAQAVKPLMEKKMALFTLASKKVRSLAYGAIDWAFVSPLKRTFKPVATIAQFSICYLTLAAAGYFAYGLYQNPQSVVEWISEISPVEIRLKNTEE